MSELCCVCIWEVTISSSVCKRVKNRDKEWGVKESCLSAVRSLGGWKVGLLWGSNRLHALYIICRLQHSLFHTLTHTSLSHTHTHKYTHEHELQLTHTHYTASENPVDLDSDPDFEMVD